MRLKHLLLLTSAGVFGLLVDAGLSTGALAQAAPALAGQVTSADEGPMEGVLVSARKQSSTVTVTVVTDAKGQYSFPADRLDPGHYAIAIRAVGYNLHGPTAVDSAGGSAKADSKLAKTKNLANQLSNAEWLLNAHGPDNLTPNLSNN